MIILMVIPNLFSINLKTSKSAVNRIYTYSSILCIDSIIVEMDLSFLEIKLLFGVYVKPETNSKLVLIMVLYDNPKFTFNPLKSDRLFSLVWYCV